MPRYDQAAAEEHGRALVAAISDEGPSSLTSVLQALTRNLSSSETATALRPFYFAVHPDLFGKYPEQRAVNEESLKRLNQYIDNLRTNQRSWPTELTFFVRDTRLKKKPKQVPLTLREVRIALLSDCPRETVRTVLRSCNLSLDYVNQVPHLSPEGVVHWSPFTQPRGRANPFSGAVRNKPPVTLDIWLSKNIETARQRQDALAPIVEHIEVLKQRLMSEVGIKDVRWENKWGLVQFRASLLSLLRLCEQHCPEQLCLRDHAIIFGNETGVCLHGDITLRSDDVHDHWLQVLRKLHKQMALLDKIPAAEQELSSVLNSIKISRHTQRQTLLANKYYPQVCRLTEDIRRQLLEKPEAGFDQSLRDVELVLECGGGELTVSREGQIVVPFATPGFLVLDFVLHNAYLARQKKQEYLSRVQAEQELINHVIEEYQLSSLAHDENISSDQMRECCERLIKTPENVGVTLRGAKLCVAQFYSVMSDGEICIPWNFKGAFD